MTHQNDILKGKMLECVNSLHLAMDKAGGKILTTEDMKKLSLYDFLLLISPNDIRFVCDNCRNRRYEDEDDGF